MKNKTKLIIPLIFVLFIIIVLNYSIASAAKEYLIGEGDVIEVIVRDNQDLTKDLVVRPDGKISFPLLGDVQASGMTAANLREFLTNELAKYVQYPNVTVIIKDAKNYKVNVLGGGIKSQVLTLQGPTPLLQVLLQLGLDQNANLKDAYISRNNEKLPPNFYDLVIKGDLSQNITVEPNDTIFIPPVGATATGPTGTMSPTGPVPVVQIVGEIRSPQTIPYREGLRILDVILQAGGFTDFASQNKVKIVRKKGEKVEEIRVKAKDVLKGDISKNILLEPGDLIVVPQSLF
jgi:polysaccharide export outer membrane protein